MCVLCRCTTKCVMISVINIFVMLHCVTCQGIKELMEGMNDKEALIHIRNTNHERLLLELERLVVVICHIFISVLTLIVVVTVTSVTFKCQCIVFWPANY